MTHGPLTASVSVFQGSTNTTPVEAVALATILQRIQDGTYQQYVEALRAKLAMGDTALYDHDKKRSVGFTPAGLFTRRANAGLAEASGLVHFDFDHLANLPDAKARLTADPWIAYAFVSPSGDGLKVAIWTGGILNDATYKHAWRVVLGYFQQTYPDLAVANDRACKDIARMCYTSWDPDLYMNPTARLYALPPDQTPAAKPTPGPRSPAKASPQPTSAGEYTRVETALQVIPAEAYEIWLRVGMALHSSGEPWARGLWDTWSARSEKYDAAEQDTKWASFTRDGAVTLGSLFHLAQEHGYTPSTTPAPPVAPLPGEAPAEPPAGTNSTTPPVVPGGLGLLFTKDLRPRGALANVLAVLTRDPHWQKVLGYNALSDEVMFLKCPPCYETAEAWVPRPLEDHDDAEIATWIQRRYEIFTATSTVHEAVQAAAHRHAFHPIRNYLRGLKWDQTPRLDRWLTTYCGVADTPYTRAVGRTTLIGAVARVVQPGCKMDTALVLIGPQGIGKSTTWRVLCSDEWFSDTLPDLHDKDAMQALRGKWIIELGELATLHRSEIEVIKRYLSATQDHYRPSYGRRARTFLRQNIFVGTTNKEDIFKDETGNRRFYPITTTGICAIDALTHARDQLWAEVVHRYYQGEAWYLDAAMTALAEQVQAAHMEHDPWENKVLDYVAPYAGTHHATTLQIMREALLLESADKWTLATTRRIGTILHNHGWRNSRPRDAQGKQYAAFWHPPDRSPMVTDGTDIPWPVGVGNAVTDVTDPTGIGNTIGNTKAPHEIRPATDVTDVTDHFSYTREKAPASTHQKTESQKEHTPFSTYIETIGNIGNIGNTRIDAGENAVTDVLPMAAIGNTSASAPCPHLDTSMQGAGLVCTRCGASLF